MGTAIAIISRDASVGLALCSIYVICGIGLIASPYMEARATTFLATVSIAPVLFLAAVLVSGLNPVPALPAIPGAIAARMILKLDKGAYKGSEP
jgi:hypothetical protein